MLRSLIKTFTLLWLLGMYLVLMATFMVAYQSPHKAVRIMIDNYKEAQIELIMLTGGFLIAFLGSCYLFMDIKRDYIKGVSFGHRKAKSDSGLMSESLKSQIPRKEYALQES
ncbi:MAG: hypothetical protein QXN71_01470 [Candidatus Aenigmatarchaeota archaeon]